MTWLALNHIVNTENQLKTEVALRILVVDDEGDFRAALNDLFSLEGYQSQGVGSMAEYNALLRTGHVFDLLILDRNLPDGEGLEILRDFRQVSDKPVLVITGAGTTADKVSGFDADADHYLVKPIVTAELLAIIKKYARSREKPCQVAWELDMRSWCLKDPVGTAIKLTRRELSLLSCFVDKTGQHIERATVIHALGEEASVYDLRRLEVLVRRLRNKILEHTPHEFRLLTVYGSGYTLNCEMHMKNASE